MISSKKGSHYFFTLLCLFSSWSSAALAQGVYPSHPIKVIVSYPAGGSNDLVARLVGEEMGKELGQRFVIENKSGAGGVVGAETAARAAPDGYTLFMAGGAHALAPSLNKSLGYDLVKDFEPISLAAIGTYLLVVHPSVPVTSVKELIEFAKSKPGVLSYASSGAGAPPHLAAVLFEKMTGTTLNHVPYRGDTPAIADLVAGHVQLSFISIAPLLPQVKSGALRALAITSGKRSTVAPEVMTLSEAGLAGYDVGTWWGLLAPAKTPQPIVERLAAAMQRAVNLPAVRDRFLAGGIQAMSNTPTEFAAMIKSELIRYGTLVKAAGIDPT